MKDIFVTVTLDEHDKNLIENLEEKGFENLGEDEGCITYLKEKEMINETGKGNAMAA